MDPRTPQEFKIGDKVQFSDYMGTYQGTVAGDGPSRYGRIVTVTLEKFWSVKGKPITVDAGKIVEVHPTRLERLKPSKEEN